MNIKVIGVTCTTPINQYMQPCNHAESDLYKVKDNLVISFSVPCTF